MVLNNRWFSRFEALEGEALRIYRSKTEYNNYEYEFEKREKFINGTRI